MASVVYNSFKRDIMNGSINLHGATDTINVLLVTSTYSPNIDTHTKRSDITNEVANGNGYATGGAALASKVVAVDNTGDKGTFDAADITWANSSITARGAVLYKARGGASSADELIAYVDFGSDKTSSSGDFTISWNATGILTLS